MSSHLDTSSHPHSHPLHTHQVEVEVDAVDKGGNFIGWLSVDGKNLSILLVEEGLCKVLPQAERLTFGRALFDAEEKAREARKNLWEVRVNV